MFIDYSHCVDVNFISKNVQVKTGLKFGPVNCIRKIGSFEKFRIIVDFIIIMNILLEFIVLRKIMEK